MQPRNPIDLVEPKGTEANCARCRGAQTLLRACPLPETDQRLGCLNRADQNQLMWFLVDWGEVLEGQGLPAFKVNIRAAGLLKKFVIEGGFGL